LYFALKNKILHHQNEEIYQPIVLLFSSTPKLIISKVPVILMYF